LKELNPYVRVNVTKELNFKNYSLICVTEVYNNMEEVIEWNNLCHENGIGFLLSQNLGATAYAFADFGNEFVIFDEDGEETKQFIVSNVTKGEQGICTVHDDKRHKYQDGDFVIFKELQGMTQLNDQEPRKIVTIDGFNFKIGDTSNFGDYTREGIVENIKLPKKVNFHDLKTSMTNPVASSSSGMLDTPDLRFWGRSDHIHIAL
jgi:ubiquitin-activating enzyme E1